MSYHPHRPSYPSTSPSPDIQGARTLASFLAQRSAPSQGYRESPNTQEFASRAPRTGQVYEQRNVLPQGPNYPNNHSREYHPSNPGRQPSLSLDTRNLVPPSGRTPSPASVPGALHGDLTTLKAGLESLWTRSAHTLHTLHGALASEREARHRTLREREMLAAGNARMWEDKARLEGEKRELRARLDAQAAMADVRERASGRRAGSGGVRVKMEDSDDEDNVTVPLREVQQIIEERLQRQADEFAKETTELYAKLAAAQSRVHDLETHLTRPPMRPVQSPATTSAHAPAQPSPSPMTPHTSRPSAQSEGDFPFVRRRPGSSGDTDVQMQGMTRPAETTHAMPGAPLQDSRAYGALRQQHPRPPRDSYAHRQPHSTTHPHPHPQQQDFATMRTVSLPTTSPPSDPPPRRTTSNPSNVDPSQHVPPPPPAPPQPPPHRPRHVAQQQQQQIRHHPPSQRSQHSSSHSALRPGHPPMARLLPPPQTQRPSPPNPAHTGLASRTESHPGHPPRPESYNGHPPQPGSFTGPLGPDSYAGRPRAESYAGPSQRPEHPTRSPLRPEAHIEPPRRPEPPAGPRPRSDSYTGPPQRPHPPTDSPPRPPAPPSSASSYPAVPSSSYPPTPPPPLSYPPALPPPPSSYPPTLPPPPSSHPPAPPAPPPPSPPPPAPTMVHSRPSTPTPRPAKRARTAQLEMEMDPGPEAPHEMTEDERRTLGALNSVLTKKRDGAGWKCVLCRQEKKNPTATFSEATPIGTVTQHVRGVHVVFWETLGRASDPP